MENLMDKNRPVEAELLTLPTSKKIALIKMLQRSVDDEIGLASDEIAEQLIVAEMNQRLVDFDAGLIPSEPWEAVRTELLARYE